MGRETTDAVDGVVLRRRLGIRLEKSLVMALNAHCGESLRTGLSTLAPVSRTRSRTPPASQVLPNLFWPADRRIQVTCAYIMYQQVQAHGGGGVEFLSGGVLEVDTRAAQERAPATGAAVTRGSRSVSGSPSGGWMLEMRLRSASVRPTLRPVREIRCQDYRRRTVRSFPR